MALDIQTIAATGSYVPYERPPQPATLWTAIPRGIQSFIVAGEALDAKALNDDQLLQITATLPPNFAYVFQDINLTLSGEVSAWNVFCNMNLQNFYRTTEDLATALALDWVYGIDTNTLFNSSISLTTANNNHYPPPTYPLIALPGSSGVLFVFTASNASDPSTAIGVVNFAVSFWVFDLEQIRKYPVNMAMRTF